MSSYKEFLSLTKEQKSELKNRCLSLGVGASLVNVSGIANPPQAIKEVFEEIETAICWVIERIQKRGGTVEENMQSILNASQYLVGCTNRQKFYENLEIVLNKIDNQIEPDKTSGQCLTFLDLSEKFKCLCGHENDKALVAHPQLSICHNCLRLLIIEIEKDKDMAILRLPSEDERRELEAKYAPEITAARRNFRKIKNNIDISSIFG